jgi:predicted 3-demethylubiquinone-9 3-methyltransferase (glyoxalase superfamily)
MPKLNPFLWFDNQAEEAANFYVSVFPNSKITQMSRSGAAGPGEPGKVMTIAFELDGKPFAALNGGPYFQFNEAVSFWVDCADQAEVDYYWNGLTADGGKPSRCGWLKDRFGVSWQIVPRALGELMSDPDPAKRERVNRAMLAMDKLDVAGLEAAAAGGSEP